MASTYTSCSTAISSSVPFDGFARHLIPWGFDRLYYTLGEFNLTNFLLTWLRRPTTLSGRCPHPGEGPMYSVITSNKEAASWLGIGLIGFAFWYYLIRKRKKRTRVFHRCP